MNQQQIIVYRGVNDLIPYARNSRTHSEEQVLQIASSIKEFGFTNPVLIDHDGGIIAGHGRVMAARKVGMDQVPTIELAHLTETQKRAYIIADNKMALNAGWDNELLAVEFAELSNEGFDLSLTGFDDDEIAGLTPQQCEEGLTDEDAVPEVPVEPVTKLGDIWICGNHRVMCGDSTSVDAVSDLMGDYKNIDICFTSPPYNADVVIMDGKHDKKYKNYNDNLNSSDYCDFLISFLSVAQLYCEYTFVNLQSLSNNKTALIDFLYKSKDTFADYMIWDKCGAEPAMGSNVLNSQFEFVYVFSKKANRAIGNVEFRGTLSNIVSIPSRQDKEYSSIHKATFPVSFAEHFISNFAEKSVFDPFGGAGTSMIASEKTGRHSKLMELDPMYCDVIVKRWQDFTGKEAIHSESGETFNSMVAN